MFEIQGRKKLRFAKTKQDLDWKFVKAYETEEQADAALEWHCLFQSPHEYRKIETGV